MFKNLIFLVALCVVLLSLSCGGDKNDSRAYSTITRLKSTDLAASPKSSKARRSAPAASCPTNFTCLTPTNLEGRVYSGGLMVGGNGSSGYSVTTVGATSEIRQRPDLGQGGVDTFNVGQTTDLTGDYICCGEDNADDGGEEATAYPDDANALVSRLEFNFDYLDTTFTVPSSAGANIAGKSYTIRIVYVNTGNASDIVSGVETAFTLGDKLVKAPGETTFKWCTTSACTFTERPATPLRESYTIDTTLEGNDNYYTFSMQLINDPLSFTKAEAMQGNWIFTVDFDMDNAAIFDFSRVTGAAGWSDIKSEEDLVSAFILSSSPGDQNTSIRVGLSKAQQ